MKYEEFDKCFEISNGGVSRSKIIDVLKQSPNRMYQIADALKTKQCNIIQNILDVLCSEGKVIPLGNRDVPIYGLTKQFRDKLKDTK